MSSFSGGGLTTAGSTTLPVCALTGGTTVLPRILEIAVFNTTVTPVALKLCRLTTAGTPGANMNNSGTAAHDPASVIALLKNTYSSTAPTTTDLGMRCVLGAAIGSGYVWTFEDWALTVADVANAGIGILVENGTGQALQTYWRWRE